MCSLDRRSCSYSKVCVAGGCWAQRLCRSVRVAVQAGAHCAPAAGCMQRAQSCGSCALHDGGVCTWLSVDGSLQHAWPPLKHCPAGPAWHESARTAPRARKHTHRAVRLRCASGRLSPPNFHADSHAHRTQSSMLSCRHTLRSRHRCPAACSLLLVTQLLRHRACAWNTCT